MSKISQNKPAKNSDELFSGGDGAPPISSTVTTGQLIAVAKTFSVALDETFLRNRANEKKPNPRTGRAWIPKPVNSAWPQAKFSEVMFGLLEWFSAKASAEGEPLDKFVFQSMEACAARTGIPKSFLQTAKANGCDAFDGSRVRLAPLIRWIFTRDAGGETVNWQQHGDKFKALNEEVKYREAINEFILFDEHREFVQRFAAVLFATIKRLRMEAPRELEMLPRADIKKILDAKVKAALDAAQAEIAAITTAHENKNETDESIKNEK